ncbi:MAG: MFS transporter [Planctomycetota bacterium]
MSTPKPPEPSEKNEANNQEKPATNEQSSLPEAPVPENEKYRCGTLQYTKAGLFLLFSWLLLGDFCFQIFEHCGGPDILKLYLQDNFHTSNLYIYILFIAIPNAIGVVMTPFISFKSDRCRSRFGRRIPYMLFTMPFLCLFAAAIGFSDDVIEYFKAHLTTDSFITPLTAAMIIIGLLTIGYTFFYEFVGTVYWYLFADVVPEHFLGRFMGLFRMVSMLAGFLINVTIAEYQLTHMKAIHIGVAVLYFVGFGLMCWRVKEGKYPPVTDVTKETPFWVKVKIYFKECFTHPIFILIYCMSGTAALSKGVRPAGVFSLHLGKHQTTIAAHTESASYVAMTPDGKVMVSGGQDGLINLWDGSNREKVKLIKSFKGHGGAVLCVSLTPDGNVLAAGSSKGLIEVWNASGGEEAAQSLIGHEGEVRGITLSKDGTRLASAGADKTVRLWDVQTGKCANTLTGHDDRVNCVAFSMNADRLLSGGSDTKIILWDVAQGTKLKTLEGHPGPVYTVCFAPALEKAPEQEKKALGWLADKSKFVFAYLKDVFTNESMFDIPPDTNNRVLGDDLWVLSGGRDGDTDAKKSLLRIWDIAEGKLLKSLLGHKQAIRSIVYKSDCRVILSGSQDSSVRLWKPLEISKTANDQSFKTFLGYTHAVTSIACMPTGTTLVNASNDGMLHVWDIDQGVSLRKAGIRASFFTIITLLLAYPFGALVDRFHPVRMILWTSLLSLPFTFLSFWWLQDYMSGLWLTIIAMPFSGLHAAASMVFLMLLFPKAKYGQMCSAEALVRQAVTVIAGFLGAIFLDWLTDKSLNTDNFRYGYLFTGVTSTLSVLSLLGVYYYWKKLGGDKYVAPEV